MSPHWSAPTPGSMLWFAGHEIQLAYRDWLGMMTAGKRARERIAVIATLALIGGLHALAYALIAEPLAAGMADGKPALVLFTALAVLAFSLMLSQAIESVTRTFYARADLDLILSSPAPAARLFAVRISAIVLSSAVMSLLLAAPFVHVAVWIDGLQWLAIVPVVIALAALATAVSLVVTVALFKAVGARRTRLIAQIVAAVVGAAFLIGTQIGAILSYGELSRMSLFTSQEVIAWAPAANSPLWWVARAGLGELGPLLGVVAMGAAVLGLAIATYAGRFGYYVLAAASLGEASQHAKTSKPLTVRNPAQALRAKEWRLLARDPWLISQTLMQILYLIPPAVLLWRNYGAETGALVILAPILVMAVGQLAGGLSWLAISGEDAHDLVATAPIAPRQAIGAKIQSVLSIALIVTAPLLLVMTIAQPWVGFVTSIAVVVSSSSALAIQLWFRTQASRRMFRRRQNASRASTMAEAFSSISWAGAAALAAAGSPLALIFVATSLAVLTIAWYLRPASAG